MSWEVFLYCDTCGSNALIDVKGIDRLLRRAAGQALAAAKSNGFVRTKKGWQCPGCQRGRPGESDVDGPTIQQMESWQNLTDAERKKLARRKLLSSY